MSKLSFAKFIRFESYFVWHLVVEMCQQKWDVKNLGKKILRAFQ
jgi:hypothetical protein